MFQATAPEGGGSMLQFPFRSPGLLSGHGYLPSIEAVVAAAIIEIVTQAVADPKDLVGRHGDVPPVVQAMEVAPQQ